VKPRGTIFTIGITTELSDTWGRNFKDQIKIQIILKMPSLKQKAQLLQLKQILKLHIQIIVLLINRRTSGRHSKAHHDALMPGRNCNSLSRTLRMCCFCNTLNNTPASCTWCLLPSSLVCDDSLSTALCGEHERKLQDMAGSECRRCSA